MNSLAQLVLKITSPGVPDFYQGTELWHLSLVDPDNRRPVDFEHRARLLASIEPLLDPASASTAADQEREVGPLLGSWADGRIKLFVTACGLRLRRSDPDLVLRGDYLPLEAEVTVSAGVVAFARMLEGRALVTIVPRLSGSLCSGEHAFPIGMDCWKTSRVLLPPALAGRSFRNLLTGERIEPARTVNQSWLVVGER